MRILRLKQTLERTGNTRSPHYQSIADGLFTRAVKLGGARASGWPEHEVEAIVVARVAGASDDFIRDLVSWLHEARAPHLRAVRKSLDDLFTFKLAASQPFPQASLGIPSLRLSRNRPVAGVRRAP